MTRKARIITVVASMLICVSLHAQICVVADCTQIADHGTDLLENRAVPGQIMVLDPWSVPIVRDGVWEGYAHVPRQFAIQEHMLGLRFNRKMEDGILLYDVMVLHASEPDQDGQIAVQVSEPVGPLDPFQFWVVEPKGRTYEGTTAQGLVIRIPLVRFLRYRAFPVFDPKEPKVDRNTTAALFSQLYGLRKQLETNVEQVTLATCGTSCDLEGLRKTQAVLDEFNKTLQALADSLRTEQLELAAQKQYRENHEGNGDVETVVFEQNTISGEQSALKNKDMAYAAWVQGQITRRSAEHAATPAPWQLQGPLYKAGGGVTPPQLVYAPDPQYTDEARREKIQGVSMVSLIVDEEGRPQRIVTLRPLGHGLDEKALEAVRQYHFKPAMLQGKPVPVEANIEVNFRLY